MLAFKINPTPSTQEFRNPYDFADKLARFAFRKAKLSCSSISNQQAIEIAKSLERKEYAATKLTYLDLSNNNIDPVAMETIIEKLPSSIEEINLKGNILSEKTISYLIDSIQEKELKSCLVNYEYAEKLQDYLLIKQHYSRPESTISFSRSNSLVNLSNMQQMR